MKQETIDTAIRQQYEHCRQRGKVLVGNFDVEQIHAFRVETKRLRALLRLAASGDHSAVRPKLPKNLKVFYDMTGKLRCLQLQKRSLEEAAVRLHQGVPAKCIAVMEDRISTVEDMVRIYLRACEPLGREKKQWHDPIPGRVADAAAEAFIADKRKVIILPDATGLPADEQLHTIRKAIKDLIYSWPHFSKGNMEQVIVESLPPRKQLQTCAAQLGDLHDVIVQLSLLRDRSFLLCVCPHSARFLEAAEQLWLQDKQALLEKIKAALLPWAVLTPATAREEDEGEKDNPMAACNSSAAAYT